MPAETSVARVERASARPRCRRTRGRGSPSPGAARRRRSPPASTGSRCSPRSAAICASVAPVVFFSAAASCACASASAAAASTDALPNSTTLSTTNAPPTASAAFLANADRSWSRPSAVASSTSLVICDVSARNLAMIVGPEAIAHRFRLAARSRALGSRRACSRRTPGRCRRPSRRPRSGSVARIGRRRRGRGADETRRVHVERPVLDLRPSTSAQSSQRRPGCSRRSFIQISVWMRSAPSASGPQSWSKPRPVSRLERPLRARRRDAPRLGGRDRDQLGQLVRRRSAASLSPFTLMVSTMRTSRRCRRRRRRRRWRTRPAPRGRSGTGSGPSGT